MENNFCRRCGSALSQTDGHIFACANGHTIYANAAPAVGLILLDQDNRMLVLERAHNPGKGFLDIPGGFCDGAETAEAAVARETLEEVGIQSSQYTTPQLVISALDYYDFAGETVTVLSITFWAKLTEPVSPVAGDDAASAEFVDLASIGKLFFAGVQAAVERFTADHSIIGAEKQRG